MSDNKLIQSYVFHEDKAFFVSTIDRESSDAYAYGARYSETIVWELNKVTKQRGEQLYMGSAARESIHKHQEMCKELFETGKIED